MQPGDIVCGRYRLEKRLGEGGMGEVWAAMHVVTEQRRALKRVHEDDDGARKRMLREARAACAVKHPNVVAVHDVMTADDGEPVLVMDLLEGETLEARLEREGRLPVADVVAIASGIAAGLEAAHALGIIHRDLKPANVFLAPEPKILDFGVAKLTAESGPARATNLLTESGAMVGTPCYMAPEQAFGDGEVDARTDLWALGVVLYECLSGVRPADGATVGQVFKVLATGAIVPLAERAPHVPRVLLALVDRLLSIPREGRPESAHAVREALAAIAAAPAGDEPAPGPVPVRAGSAGSGTTTTDGTAVAEKASGLRPQASGRERAAARRGVGLAAIVAVAAFAAAAVVGIPRLTKTASPVAAVVATNAPSAAPVVVEPPRAVTLPEPAPVAPVVPASTPSARTSTKPTWEARRSPPARVAKPAAPLPAPSETSKLLTEPMF